MTRYQFTAIDGEGQKRSGVVEAESSDDANTKISSMGLMPTEVVPAMAMKGATKKKAGGTRSPASPGGKTAPKKKKGLPIGKVISFEDLAVFTRSLAILLRAGLPLLRALEVLIRQERRQRFAEVLEAVAEQVRGGGDFSEGLAQHPKIFNRLYINMVKAGEAAGNLAEVLEGLAKFMEKAVKTGNKVKSAMVYPLVVISVAVIIVMGLMIFVIPIFEGIFDEILDGAPLPLPTQIILGLSNVLKEQWLFLLLGFLGLGTGFCIFKNSEVGGRVLDRVALLVPFFSDLIQKSSVARFARTFGTLLESGVPILEALKISSHIVTNRYYVDAIVRIHDAVRDGEALSTPMSREAVFPILMTSMVEVGEETGELPEMLHRISGNYDDDVDNAVAGITSIIEPIMIVLLAVTIGFIVIALFLPIIEIMQSGFGG